MSFEWFAASQVSEENSAIDARKCIESMGVKIKHAHDRGEDGTDMKLPSIAYKNWRRLAHVHYILVMRRIQRYVILCT